MIAPPPPTQFRELADSAPAVAERLRAAWALADSDDLRWELERLGQEIEADWHEQRRWSEV